MSNSIINKLSSLFSKNKKIILMTGSSFETFNENSKYLYYFLSKKKEFNVYWITNKKEIYDFLKNKGLRVAYRVSFKSIYLFLKAGFVFGTGESYPNLLNLISAETIKINLWHGYGPRSNFVSFEKKKNIIKKSLNKNKIKKELNNWDYLNCTSKHISNYVNKRVNINKNKLKIFGFPRCDRFFNKKYNKTCLNKKKLSKKYFSDIKKDKVVLYAPTWRTKISYIPLFNLKNFNFIEFDQFLLKNNLFFLINLHHHTKYENNLNLKRIKFIKVDNFKFDINEILPEIDILITDYSSIATDFAILNRKIIYLMPDYEIYKKKIGFLKDIKKLKAGKISINLSDLQKLLKKKNDSLIEKSMRKNYLNFYYDINLKNSSQNIYQFIKSLNVD